MIIRNARRVVDAKDNVEFWNVDGGDAPNVDGHLQIKAIQNVAVVVGQQRADVLAGKGQVVTRPAVDLLRRRAVGANALAKVRLLQHPPSALAL